MEDYLALLTDDEKPVILALADAALELGYRIKRDKTKDLSYGLAHPKIRKRILRFSLNNGKPMVRIKYFAAPEYSAFFHEAIRRTITAYRLLRLRFMRWHAGIHLPVRGRPAVLSLWHGTD